MVLDQCLSSTSLRRIVYSEIAASLWVQFSSGAVYRYADVPADVVAKLLAAPSHGGFFATNVRNAFLCRVESQSLTEILTRAQATDGGQRFALELPMHRFCRSPWEWQMAA